MIIGLTGRNASGKGEVAQYLKERGFTFYSLSDVLRDELKRKKKTITRVNLIWLGNKLRDEKGPSVLADKIMDRLQDDHHYVIDSFRNPEEVKAFRRTREKDFVLLSVEASAKKRFERIKRRPDSLLPIARFSTLHDEMCDVELSTAADGACDGPADAVGNSGLTEVIAASKIAFRES